MGLRLNITGLKKAELSLARFADLIDDYGPLWERYIAIMTEVELEWFASKGNGTWAPLAKSTVKRKPKTTKWYKSRGQYGPFPLDPLIATGKLLEELTDPSEAAEIGQGRTSLGTFDVKSLSWGTDDPIAEYHWDGRTTPNFMPARPPIQWPPSPATMARFDRANEDFVRERAREAGIDK